MSRQHDVEQNLFITYPLNMKFLTKEEVNKLFGENVKSFRKSKKLTQEQLAEISEMSGQTISSIEIGDNFPNFNNLVSLSNALEKPLKMLFDFDIPYDDTNDPKLKPLSEKKRKLVIQIAQLLAELDEDEI